MDETDSPADDPRSVTAAPPRPSAARSVVLVVATLVAAAGVAVAAAWQSGQTSLPGRVEADAVTIAMGALLGFVASVSALVALARLVQVVAFARRPAREDGHRLSGAQLDALTSASRWSLNWAVAALAAVPFSAAISTGVPVAYFLYSPGDFLTANQSAQAWLLTAAIAFLVAILTRFVGSWPSAVVIAGLVAFGGLPSVLTNQVSVGAGHDLATDAATVFTLASSAWFAITWAAGESWRDPSVIARYRLVAGVALLLSLAARVGIAAFELVDELPWQSGYGMVLAGLLALLIILAVLWLVRLRSAITPRWDPVLMIFVLGAQAALTAMIPPRYWWPQSAQENYLGFDVPVPPQAAEMLLPGRPNLLFAAAAVAAILLYGWGFLRLRRRGDHWPVHRMVTWTLAWLIVLVVTTSRVWMYSSAMFSWHMAVHMTFNMLVPVLIVLSGPITLLQRAGRVSRPGDPYRIRDAVNAALLMRPVRLITHPLVVWVIFIGSFYALYFSGLFDSAMKYHWAHQLMTLHFLIAGCLFYGLAVGVDAPPRPIPHVAKLGFVFAAMPFHAFFAVAVLSGGSIIGENFYTSLGLAWPHDLAADQQVGGQIAWATGELPLLIIIVALVAQWFRSDQREARRKDRTVRGRDDELDAYNTMLAELARRESDREVARDDRH
ncbi:cytochrome c oxidase assembly protein [Microlunatus sp. GCM10028923]|uniref:cytochrome c oxidase assembly protein n=1 Tax=Microlunatus sp. GCM10028923 TaxID=3273400 RepID=UPI0036236B3B